jgi:hypothetical protein
LQVFLFHSSVTVNDGPDGGRGDERDGDACGAPDGGLDGGQDDAPAPKRMLSYLEKQLLLINTSS